MKQKPRTTDQHPPAGTKDAALASGTGDPFKLGPIAIDLRDILGDALDANVQDTVMAADPGEVDLTEAITGLTAAQSSAEAPADLDAVFKDFREEVSRQTRSEEAERHYKVGIAYRDMGMLREAVTELAIAVRAPRLRFEAASQLGRIALKQGQRREAIEWFERAAEAPAPTREAGRTLLYELGDALEAAGDAARALAVFIEIKNDAPRFRDVAKRVDRLSRK